MGLLIRTLLLSLGLVQLVGSGTSPVSMLRLRGGLAPASGTKGALKVDLSQARKRTARSKGKWTGASRPFASGDSDEDSEDEEPDDSGNEFDKMLAKDEDDDPLSGDVEEIAALSFDEWQARVQAREDKKAIGQRHEDTDYGVGFLEGRFTEEFQGWTLRKLMLAASCVEDCCLQHSDYGVGFLEGRFTEGRFTELRML
ncbi:hypothetical protein T484DRAFT_1811422 [Baffinella frigidus]|nr:hypothetical protein T484DRAFT_1811422 [Cryptophyta sp. CCMP2293]